MKFEEINKEQAASIVSKYILLWTSFRSDSNYTCQSNTMQRENCNRKKHVPRKGTEKGLWGQNHCDSEPKDIINV